MFGFGSSSKTEEKKDGKHYFNPNAAVNLPVTIKQVEELNPLENKKLIPSFLIAVKRHVYFGDLDDKGLPHGVGLFLFGCEPLLFQYLQEKFDQRPDKKTPMRPEEEVLEVLSCNNEQFGDFTMYDRYGGCWVHGSFHGEGVLLCYANYTNQPIPLCVQNNPTSSPTAPSPTANLTLQMGPMLNHNKFSFKYQGNFHLGRPQGSAEIFYGKYYSEPLPVLEKNPAFFSLFAAPIQAPGEDASHPPASSGTLGSAIMGGLSYLSPFSSSSEAPVVPAFYKETMINVSSSHKPKEYFGTVGGGQFLFKHGKGILVYQNGDTYDGEFVFNVRHGKGKLNLVNKTEEYEGQFQRNRKNGYGVLRYLHTNQYYKGNFVDDVREGEGVMRFSNGDEYLGNFKHNSIEGFGTMKYKNGDIYEGEWKEGIRNGLGTYSLKKNKLGMTMKGFFVNGLVHGEGSLEVPGISVFVGDFRRGERTSGTIYFLSDAGDPRVDFDLQSSTPSPPPENKNDEKDAEKDATTGPLPRVRRCYQGEWDGDNMEGKGLLWYSDDSFYCGYFRRNQRQGPGNLREIHRYPDTTTPYYITEYSGFFYKDKKQGWGIERDQHMEEDDTRSTNRDIIDALMQESAPSGATGSTPYKVCKIRCGLWYQDRLVEGYVGEWDGESFCGLGTMHLNLLSFFRNNNSGSTAALFDKAVQEINPLFYPATGGGILRLFGASQGNKEQTSKEEKDYTNQLVYISPSTAQSITVPVLLEQFFQARSNTSKKKRNSAASSGGQTYIVSTAEREMVWFFGLFLSGKKHGPGMFAFPALGSLPGSPLFYNNTIQANHGGGVRRHIIQAEWLDNTLHTSDDNQKKKKQRGVWVFPTGEVYYGHFRQGKREDTEGVLLLLDGSLYVGPFKENQPCGKGLLLVKNVQEPLYRAQSRSKRCHTTEEEETEQSLLEEEEQKDHNTNAEEDNNNNIISKTVGALFSLFSSSTVAADSTTHENSLSKRYSPSYVKYLRNRKLVGFRDYFILIAEWEVQTLPTRKVFHVSKKKSSSKKDNNAIHVPILQASSCINTASNTPSYHYTPSSYDFLNYNTNTKTIPIHPNSSLADALDFLNERSEEEGEGYEHGYYEALPPPPVTTVSKVVHHGLQYFVSSNMFVYTDNHENNTIGMHIPHRPLSAYDRYITQLREQNFFNGSTHSALYMLDDNTNNNNNAKEDEVVTFFQQSSLSPIMEEFLRWKEEMAFFTANRNHQNNKNDKTAAQYFSPLQMKEGNGNFPKKDGNKDQTIQSRMTANTPQRCSICEKEFSFLKKSVFCSLCFRNVCSSCLHAIEITDTSNNNVALMALADKSNKLLTTFQKIMTDLQNKKNNNDKEIEFAKYFPKSFYTTIENISNENTDEEKTAESSECFYNTIPSLDVSTHPNRTVTSNSSVSVSACPDCARTVLLLNLEYQTIFIPQRMFQSVLFYPNPNHHNEIKMESIRNGTQSESLPPMSEAVKTASVVVEEQEGEEEKEMTANTHENEVSTPIKENTVAVEDMPSPTPAVPTTEEEQTEHYIIYKGYLSKGLPHLYGELWWTTTNPLAKEKGPSYHYYYSGSFYEGKRHGYGVLVYDSDHHRNGERYEGNFSHNYFEGKHNYYFCADGSVLEGDFHRNRLTSINYYGETEKVENGKYNNNNNIRHGRGIYFYNVRNLKTQRRAQPLNSHNVSLDFTVSPGTVYNGEWQKGIRHGSGMLLFFAKRVREILGDATLPNNHNTFYELTRIFRGTLQQNALNGKGLLQEGKDSFYYGDFSDNMKNGKGVEFFYHKDFVNRHAEMSIHELFENSSKLYKNTQNKELLFSRIYESTFQNGLVHGYCKQYTFFSHPSEKQYPFSIYETSYHSGSERDDCYDIQLLVDDNASTACCNCQKGFSLLSRRHHCRLCGLLFCSSCSAKRAVLPSHFYSDENNNNNNNANANAQQRVCDDCFLRLEQRRQLAVKRYYFYNGDETNNNNGIQYAVYAGTWSHNKFVGRGLYYRSDGIFIVMNDRGQPLLPAEERNTSNNNSNKTSGLVDQGPSREQLHEYTVSSSKKDLESFLLWWSRVIIRCGLSIHIEGGLGHFLQRYRSLASLLGNNNNNANTVSEGLKKEVSDFLTGKSASYKVQSELAQFFSNNSTNSNSNNNNFYDRCPTFPVAPSVPLFVPFHEMYQHLLDENNNNHNEVNIPNTTNNIYSLFQPYLSSAEKDDEEDSHNNSKNHHHNDNAVYTAARAAQYQMVLPPAAPTLPPASILPTAVIPPSDTTPIAQQLDTYRETVLPTLLGEVHTALEQKGEELLQEIRAQREERFLPFLPPQDDENKKNDDLVLLTCYEREKDRLLFFPPTPPKPTHLTNEKISFEYYDYLRRTPNFQPFFQNNNENNNNNNNNMSLEDYYYTLPLLLPTVSNTEYYLEKGKLQYAANIMNDVEEDERPLPHHYFETMDRVGRAWSLSRETTLPNNNNKNKNNNNHNTKKEEEKDGWIPFPFEGPFHFTLEIPQNSKPSPIHYSNELVTIHQRDVK